jgi:hypothetical protein
MTIKTKMKMRTLANNVAFAALPGPTRKRLLSPYCYHLTYHADDQDAVGCVLLWEVLGGREAYQVALERLPSGELCYHCTCPDAIYRGDRGPHTCKHVRGLQALGRGSNEVDLAQMAGTERTP